MKSQMNTSEKNDAGIELDPLDRKLIHALMVDARSSFLDLAKSFKVSNATIHARYRKLIERGVIEGHQARINLKKMGFGLTTFVGIQVVQAGKHDEVVNVIQKMPEVLEVHYTTGRYSLLAKVVARDIDGLYLFLTKKIQNIPSVASTETFLVLNSFVDREFDAAKVTKRSH